MVWSIAIKQIIPFNIKQLFLHSEEDTSIAI